jgi:hypothetical protein
VRVTTDAQLADVERELANYTPADKLDESATIAIPKTSKEDLEMQAQQTPSSGSGSKRKLWGSKGMEQPPSFDAEAASTSESPDGAAEDARESASKEEK